MSKKNFSCKNSSRAQKCKFKKLDDQVVPETLILRDKKENEKTLGFFDLLPLELKFLILSNLKALELSFLTITSKSMRNLVESFRKTEEGSRTLFNYPLKHSHPIPVDETKYMKQFVHFGLLLKRSTCLYSTKDRLSIILNFLQKFQCNVNKDCKSVQGCVCLTCYGTTLHTIIAGWDDRECVRTFKAVCSTSHMSQFIQFVLNKKAGTFSELEIQIRLFMRRVFLHNNNTRIEKSFWLDLMLQGLNIQHQARFIYLLFGPSSKDGIQWLEVCESTPASKDQTLLCFGNISNALLLLHCHHSHWTMDTIISIIDELICFPEEWLSENIASLLFLCGKDISLQMLSAKATSGKISELAYIITSFCLVCMKQGQSMDWVLELVEGVVLKMEGFTARKCMLHSIVDMFREVILDVLDLGEALDDETLRDLHILLNAQNSFTKSLIHLAYKHLIKE